MRLQLMINLLCQYENKPLDVVLEGGQLIVLRFHQIVQMVSDEYFPVPVLKKHKKVSPVKLELDG